MYWLKWLRCISLNQIHLKIKQFLANFLHVDQPEEAKGVMSIYREDKAEEKGNQILKPELQKKQASLKIHSTHAVELQVCTINK